jgi:beta-glucuronidase
MSVRMKAWPLLALSGVLCTNAAVAAPSALGFSDGRVAQSLDGAWHVIVDPYDNGLLDYRSQARPNGYFRDAPAKDKSDLVEYDFQRSPTLNVPGDWNTQRPELLYYEGTVWYERKFDAPARPAPQARQFVQFGAAAQRAIVWLNGRRLGQHEGGFTPFAFEVTGQLRPAGNSLVVMVNNTRRPAAIPAMNTDWWKYGGLTRGVRLLETPAVFIRAARVQCAKGAPGRVAGFVQLDGARGPTPVTIEIREANARRPSRPTPLDALPSTSRPRRRSGRRSRPGSMMWRSRRRGIGSRIGSGFGP